MNVEVFVKKEKGGGHVFCESNGEEGYVCVIERECFSYVTRFCICLVLYECYLT